MIFTKISVCGNIFLTYCVHIINNDGCMSYGLTSLSIQVNNHWQAEAVVRFGLLMNIRAILSTSESSSLSLSVWHEFNVGKFLTEGQCLEYLTAGQSMSDRRTMSQVFNSRQLLYLAT